MSQAWWITGDTLTTLRALPDGYGPLADTNPALAALLAATLAGDGGQDR